MDFDSSQPIYRQIIDFYKRKLARGELNPGDKIPSQREYAEKVQVNPNTVQRAYREMEMMQMVKIIRGQGTFITATEKKQRDLQTEMAGEIMARFICDMRSLGYRDRELVGLVESHLTSAKGDAEE